MRVTTNKMHGGMYGEKRTDEELEGREGGERLEMCVSMWDD